MHWINAKDPQADSAEIAKICEKAQAECGYIKTKADDGNFHSIFCGEKCAENYSCNYSNNKCEAMKRTADCDPKPENSVWNDNNAEGTFVQTWNGTEWVPTTHEAVFNKNSGECVFKCDSEFYWNNNACEAKPTRIVECEDLPENAEWNIVSEITQSWDGEQWSPSNQGIFNEEPSTTECRFKCSPQYAWNGSQCTSCSPTGPTPCIDSTSGLMWSAKSNSSMEWEHAVSYCENLNEGKYSDWQLPTISELRTLIINCQTTETGGNCGITDNCLSAGSVDNCNYHYYCEGCDDDLSGGHSKFGDNNAFWSYSVLDGQPHLYAWMVGFDDGQIQFDNKDKAFFVRCVRKWEK